jgi:hypothetical protein
MGEPSSDFIVLIRLSRRRVFSLLIGFLYPHGSHGASHFVVSSSSLVYLLNICSLFIRIWRFSRVLVVMLTPLA